MSEIRIVAELEVKPECRAELLPVMEKLVAGSRAEPGNRTYDLTESLDNPCLFFVIETWASAEAIEEHNASAHFQAFAAAVEGKAVKLNITKLKTLF